MSGGGDRRSAFIFRRNLYSQFLERAGRIDLTVKPFFVVYHPAVDVKFTEKLASFWRVNRSVIAFHSLGMEFAKRGKK